MPVNQTKRNDTSRRPWVIAGLAAFIFGVLWALGQLSFLVALLCALVLIAATFAFYLFVSTNALEMRTEERQVFTPLRDGLLILKQLPDPVILLGHGDKVEYANQAAIDIVGFDPTNMPLTQALRYPTIADMMLACEEGGPAVTAEFTIPTPVERYIRAYASKPDGSGTVLVFHDLTTEHRTEQMRADFVANASHELRTPLASLLGFIETLRGHARDDEEARERFLGVMQEQAERMGRLVDDLLSLSRIELNEHLLPEEQINLASIVDQVCDQLRPLAREDNIELTVIGQPDLPLIKGDRDELLQVIQNLVDNAMKYGRKGGRVEISLRKAASNSSIVEVEVRDFGEGIDEKHISRLTERFYRVDVKDSRARGGTGLGLAIVKHIVNRHRGTLEIKSKIGQGSKFIVRLPST